VQIHKLTTVDAFIVFDIESAANSTGVVRAGDKILASSATELARCTTYAYASLHVTKSGASAGINAPEADRHEAIAKFVAEVEKMAIDGTYMPDSTKTVTANDLAPLRAHDQRIAIDDDAVIAKAGLDALDALGLEMADGRAAIEGFGPSTLSLLDQLTQLDARVVAVSTPKGTAISTAGFASPQLHDAWTAHGDDCVNQLGGEVVPSNRIFGVDAEVLFVGSRLGVVNDRSAPFIRARTVVPTGPSPVTAKGFAILQHAHIELVPDFVVMAAPLAAAWQISDPTSTVADIVHQIVDDEEGLYLAACRRAEAFLRTWCDRLPFGRPLAG
jgi:hypothetical protein